MRIKSKLRLEKRNFRAAASKVWRIPHFSDLELLHARSITHTFPRHTHERYAIGVIEQGALGFYYRREHVVAPAGHINQCIPGEVHTGSPAAAGGWTYRMFYFNAATVQQIASEIAGRPRQLPYFRTGVIDDRELAVQLQQLHQRLETEAASLLEQESTLLAIMARLIRRYADDPPPAWRMRPDSEAVTKTKEYIESHFAEDISLETLSRLTHLSRYHLIRIFGQAVGLPPHAYQRQVRLRRAKTLLAAGYPIAEVALTTGFTDQSHLTRWFKRLWGFTPGA